MKESCKRITCDLFFEREVRIQAMNLIIFDIDGTLTNTTEIDAQCFVDAVKEILQISAFNTNWSQYQYSTDSGVLAELYQSLFQRDPTHQEVNIIRHCFIKNLKHAFTQNKMAFAPILGADKIFSMISQLGNWHMGIATGTWKDSALFKLLSAQIEHDRLPKSYADDHFERKEIIKKTVLQAQELHGVAQYDRLIYVGDKDWDYRAAKDLHMEFIGIGAEFGGAGSHAGDGAGAIARVAVQTDVNLRMNDYSETDMSELLHYLK